LLQPSDERLVVSYVPGQRRWRVVDGELHRLELNLHPNEASGLLTVEDEGVHLRLTRLLAG
jgi:hypothetical protein